MSDSPCKIVIDIGEAKVTFEGPEEFVSNQLEKYLARNSSKTESKQEIKYQYALPASADDDRRQDGVDERSLVAEKRPQGHHEKVAVLAFSLAQNGQAEFVEDDLRKAYIRAAIRPPKSVGQALRDAKNKFDYIQSGTRRGTYRLSPHGDRTVRFDLPREKRK